MKRELNKNELDLAMEYGWSEQECKNGYSIFTSDFMGGALHIEVIGDINDITKMYKDDHEASIQAEKDGIKIIRDLPLGISDYDFGYFIDTPKNKEIIKKHLYKRNIQYDNNILDYATDYQLF